MEPRVSALESDRFGIRVGRADGVAAADVAGLMDWARTEAVEFLIARARAADAEAAQALMAVSAQCVSTEIHFTGSVDPPPSVSTSEISPARDGEREGVIALARAAFKAYPSHYRLATRLDLNRVEAIYGNWAERCFDKEAAEITLVARRAGQIAGFSSFARTGGDGVQLVLGAVDPAARGQHLYTQLTIAGMEWAREKGLKWILAITQAGNIPAQRSWLAAGLCPIEATSTFHLWLV